jgi:hypothetical protein
MIRYLFLLFLMVWGGVSLFLVVHSLSSLLFGESPKACFKLVGLSLVWPFALMSRNGRDKLFTAWELKA